MALPIRTLVSKTTEEQAKAPYTDFGALIITENTHKPNILSYNVSLSGISEARELSEVQPAFHAAFERRHIPKKFIDLGIAEKILYMDVEADPGYAGWSPGSTSVSGFAREVAYWKAIKNQPTTEPPPDPTWRSATNRPGLTGELIITSWIERVEKGLGDDWTEKKGYDEVSKLIQLNEYNWLDPEERFKTRHQITGLLAAMATTAVIPFESVMSVSTLVNYERIDPNSSFKFVDLIFQLLKAREALLRMDRAPSAWYGGITARILYDMLISELWASNLEATSDKNFLPTKITLHNQFDGLLRFIQQMNWPFENDIRQAVTALRIVEPTQMTFDQRSWDWINGMVLPGSLFSLSLITAIHTISPVLCAGSKVLGTNLSIRRGSFGIVYSESTYWSARSIVGKVLAPISSARPTDKKTKTKCLGGWVGPCPSPNLPDTQLGILVVLDPHPPVSSFINRPAEPAVVSTEKTDKNLWVESIPPPAATDSAKLQAMRLSRTSVIASNQQSNEAVSYQAHLDFQLTKTMKTVSATLANNSIFVAAPPCRGNHRIDPQHASKYVFQTLQIEDLSAEDFTFDDTASIIVINTDGAYASESYARAWCSEEGKDAVIWKRRDAKCCFKCALMLASVDGLGTGTLIIG